MSPPNHPRLSRKRADTGNSSCYNFYFTILMSISRGLSKIRDLLIGRRVSRLENATSATQIPNDNRKKTIPKDGESFAFNWGLFRWRCGVLNVKTVGGRICVRNRLWYREAKIALFPLLFFAVPDNRHH